MTSALGGLVVVVAAAVLLGMACRHATAAADAPGPSSAAVPRHFVGTMKGTLVVITGTSTLHNWTVKGGVVDGDANVSTNQHGEQGPIALDAIHVSIPVVSLKSSEGSGMDNTMYDAMDKAHHAAITYTLTSAKLKGPPPAAGAAYHFDAVGQLTVSGKTREVKLDVAAQPNGNHLTITTEANLKMSDFGIKPPVAMLGMVKSGDAVTVKITWQLDERK